MSDEDVRKGKLSKRFEEKTDESDGTETNGESSESSERRETDDKRDKGNKENTDKSPVSGGSDTRSVSMWLPDELVEEMQGEFKRLNFKYYQEYDGELQKNRDFYPAVIREGLEHVDLESVMEGREE